MCRSQPYILRGSWMVYLFLILFVLAMRYWCVSVEPPWRKSDPQPIDGWAPNWTAQGTESANQSTHQSTDHPTNPSCEKAAGLWWSRPLNLTKTSGRAHLGVRLLYWINVSIPLFGDLGQRKRGVPLKPIPRETRVLDSISSYLT